MTSRVGLGWATPWQPHGPTVQPSNYDLGATIGRARLLVPDRDTAHAIFTDAEYGGFIAIEGDDPRLVAAAALETMAASDAYLFKKNRVEDVQTDGPAVANALMKRAAALREQAQWADDQSGGAFDWAEQVTDVFSARERLLDQAYRGVV
jgi:hypothetical protein